MGFATSIIETGVDKLVRLINSRGRIASSDAARELGVSNTVIMEWSDFLEEEGIIKIEYKFTRPFLVARKLEKKDIQEKSKEFSGKRDVFIRKAEVSLSLLDREAARLSKIKKEFDEIKKELGFDVSSIKNELEELSRYEQLKIKLDKQINEQKRTSLDKVAAMTKQFEREKKRYADILEKIRKEEKRLEREKVEVMSLEEGEKFIKNRLASLKEIVKKVESGIEKEEETVKISEGNINKLSLMAENLKTRVEKEKGLIEPLVEKSREQEKKIKELQEKVINKIIEKEKRLKGAKNASKKIRAFFKNKANLLDLVDTINKDRNELQKELLEMLKKAKAFQLSSKKIDPGKEMEHMEKKFGEVEAKKKVFEKEINRLNSLFK